MSTAILQSCTWFTPKGNGNIVEEEHEVGLFNEIKVNGNFFIHLKQGKEFSVVVRTDENLLDKIEVKTKGDMLVVKSGNAMRPSRENHLYITVPELTVLKLNGANTLKSSGIIRAESLSIELNGASNMTMEAEIDQLNVQINGAGEAYFMGIANELILQVNGAGEFNGLEMKSIKADVQINGAGECDLSVENLLIASINGVGELNYLGDPELQSSVKGAGSITQIEK
jgi:hypothetical protein